MSERIELLKAVCSTDPYRKNLSVPFSAEFWGAKWVVATDGHALVAFQSEEQLLADGTPPNIIDAVGPELKPKRKATLAALREWAGEVASAECEECMGEGSYDVPDCSCPECPGDHDCEDCDGTGSSETLRYGRMGRSVLNRNLLARVLKSAPGDGEVTIAKDGDLSPFVLRSGDWMAAIMPIRPTTEDAKDTKAEFVAMEPVVP